MEIALITVKQIVVMMTFMAIGYIFKKKNVLNDESSTTLSRLIVNVFLPAMAFSTFAENFRRDVITEKAQLLLMSLIVLTVTGIISIFLAKLFSKNKNTQAVYIYSFTIPNIGYMGYPLVKAVFGDATLLDAMIFCIPYNIYIYTIGMYLLTPIKKITPKFFLNPSIIAIFIGIAVGLSGITLPGTITDILDMGSNCMAPCAMILTGIVFARIDLISMLRDYKSYIASAIRLFIIPVSVMAVLRAVGMPDVWVLAAISMLAMPLGINSVVFPEAFGGDSETGAKVCLMSGILGIITIPIVFGLM